MKWLITTLYLLAVQILHYYLWTNRSGALTVNSHGSWGLPLENRLFAVIAALIILVAIWLGWRQKTAYSIPVLLIATSGISNILDRLWYGGVIDYIDLKYWPVFNIPDAVITCAILYYLFMAFRPRRSRRSEPAAR